jgi:hypothetical protein
MKHALILLIALFAGSGCRGNPVGVFNDDAFYHARGHYRVRYEDRRARAILPRSEWTLENFVHDGLGRPSHISMEERYWTYLTIQVEGRSHELTRIEAFDLRFVHRRDETVMWARTVPHSSIRSDTDLQVLTRDYVDRAASGSALTVNFDPEANVRARRFGARVLHEGPARVDDRAAYYVIFEHVDLDRQEAEASARGELVTLVFVRPDPVMWRSRVREGLTVPMVLIFGYASRPERHEAHRTEFESFVGRVDFAPLEQR